jgi:hypothetical protein
VDAGSYRLTVDGSGSATLSDAAGAPWTELATLFSIDGLEARDRTLSVQRPTLQEEPGGSRIGIRSSSSRWATKELWFRCREDVLEIGAAVTGDGEISDCWLLGGWQAEAGDPGGTARRPDWRGSRPFFGTVFSPEPAAPPRRLYASTDSVSLDVTSSPHPAAGHWFFTPPPFCVAFAREAASARPEDELPRGPWLTLGLATSPGAHNYTAFVYDGEREGFGVRLEYEGQTRVDGHFTSPALVFLFGSRDPYEGIARHTELLRARGLEVPATPAVDWWTRPIFCGWGEQVWLARAAGVHGDRFWLHGAEYSSQAAYDDFLAVLAERRLDPGTVVVDDKWQRNYGLPEPDPVKWPDMRGWIGRRHDEGRKVLLWWNSWGAEGLPRDECVRDLDGRAVSVDPSNPSYRRRLRASVDWMLGPDGLDADGFKVDFTANTPRGAGLVRNGPAWGV